MVNVKDKIQTWYYKKRGKTEKIYPVKVAKYRIKGRTTNEEKIRKIEEKRKEKLKKKAKIERLEEKGSSSKEQIKELKKEINNLEEEIENLQKDINWDNVNVAFDEFDRGRTRIIPDENNREIFELMKESQARGKVSYQDLDNYIREPFTSILMLGRKTFIPLQKDFKTAEDSGRESGWPKLKYCLSLETMLDWAKEDWQTTKSVAQNETERWWQDRTVQAVMIAIGFGLFYIMAAWGQGSFYLEPFTEQLASLENTMQEYMEQQELQG